MVARVLLWVGAAAMVAGLAASGGSGGIASSCRTTEKLVHTEAVFGHFASPAAAMVTQRVALSRGFKGTKIENDGCGDYELEIDGADNSAARNAFAVEAAKAHVPVSFEQTAPPLQPARGDVVGVFGRFDTLTAAASLYHRIANVEFLYLDIAYLSGRWLVVWPDVPISVEASVRAEVRKAGFSITFQH